MNYQCKQSLYRLTPPNGNHIRRERHLLIGYHYRSGASDLKIEVVIDEVSIFNSHSHVDIEEIRGSMHMDQQLVFSTRREGYFRFFLMKGAFTMKFLTFPIVEVSHDF